MLRILVLFFSIAFFHGTCHAEMPDRKKSTPTVQEILATIAPDVVPQKPCHEKAVHVHQPTIDLQHRPFVVNVDHSDPSREGIDVSHYQGQINWHRVAREGGISYAYVKATEGGDLVDNMHSLNLAAAHKAGIKVGSYHFYRPRVSIDLQMANMTSAVVKSEQDLIPLIDIEDDRGVNEDRFIADLHEFITKVTRHYGCKPLLYTGQNFYNKHFRGLFRDHLWMIAKYQDEAPILQDGRHYASWQYTAKGRVPGVNGNVDRSCLVGNVTLKSLMIK